VQTPVIRPYPRRGATNRKPADARCRFRRDDTGLAQIPAVPHRARLLGQIRFGPVEDARAPSGDNFAGSVFGGNPERVFRGQLGAVRVHHVDQRIPIPERRLVLVQKEKLVEVLAQPDLDAIAARRLVAFQDEAREEPRRTVLNRQRVRQAKIVFGDDVWIDEGHGRTLKSAG